MKNERNKIIFRVWFEKQHESCVIPVLFAFLCRCHLARASNLRRYALNIVFYTMLDNLKNIQKNQKATNIHKFFQMNKYQVTEADVSVNHRQYPSNVEISFAIVQIHRLVHFELLAVLLSFC